MTAIAHTKPSRDKILDTAEVLFARRGFAGVGLSEVAEGTGLGKSSLFHHFRSKAQLYAAVIGRILARIETTLLRALAGGGDPTARLDRLMDAFIDELAAHPTYARLLLRSLFEDDELAGDLPEEREANDTLRRITGSMAQLLREGMSTGIFRLASVTHTLQSLIGITIYHFASGEFGDELVGRPVFSPAEVKRRKQEVRALLHGGLLRRSMA
ncbi:MAG TPA: TetR/AcrR family transcriptional regulator [Candidatus Limnocylindria bacterium]|nr:TetR/AcrR family transcriptional regulator [Candidatus Limnocylindria bacterium]